MGRGPLDSFVTRKFKIVQVGMRSQHAKGVYHNEDGAKLQSRANWRGPRSSTSPGLHLWLRWTAAPVCRPSKPRLYLSLFGHGRADLLCDTGIGPAVNRSWDFCNLPGLQPHLPKILIAVPGASSRSHECLQHANCRLRQQKFKDQTTSHLLGEGFKGTPPRSTRPSRAPSF